MTEELIAYATDFVSFLLQNLKGYKSNIRNIILFGSVARGDAGKNSDVDIFINLFKTSDTTESRIAKIKKEFFESKKFKEYWKLLYIENEINCKVGNLDEWGDLKPSVVANGIILYGKYEEGVKGKNAVLFYWDKVKPEATRVQLSKKIFGYTYNGKKYTGLLEETDGIKLGTNCILVPLDSVERASEVFKKLGITPKTLYVSHFK